MKPFLAVFLVLLLLFLTACGTEPPATVDRGTITIEEYMSDLSDKEKTHLEPQTALLLHPLKDAIKLYGDNYELSWEGSYVSLKFSEAKCSFVAYIGAEFAPYDGYSNPDDFEECDVMEYLSFAVIEKVVFDGEGLTLTDGISVGMSASRICEILNVDGIEYTDSGATITTQYDKNGNKVKVYSISGQISELDYIIVFTEDILSRVEIADYTRYLDDEKTDSDNGKNVITKAVSFLTKNKLADFNAEDLSYKGLIYSSYYGSWFYGWQFTQGDYEGYEINVEQKSPGRVFIANNSEIMPMVFWCDGKYVDPILSFLGKWRDYNSKEYIDIKSISKEGIVVFDMYAYTGINTGEMFLFENLSTEFKNMPHSLEEYLRAEYSIEGEMQLYNGDSQSGFYTYAGDKFYLSDSLFMNLQGSVQYLPTGLTGRVGAGPLTIHIPDKKYEYAQESTWGYMENFGRDDQNTKNNISNEKSAGESVINKYLNQVYETSGLKYADLEYRYLYDYVFPVNNVTYNVWKSTDKESPHYLYVDTDNEMIIKECELNPVSRHTKELIYKSGDRVSNKAYIEEKYVTLDEKITVDLANNSIAKTDAFVKDIEISEIHFDMVGKNERFMFFSNIGKKYVLNGYVLFEHTTWGATLHITDSNIPGFDIGVYYLDSQTFFLDPSISVVGIPENSDNKENNKYLDNKLDEIKQDNKLVIREFGGRIIGYIYIDEQGKKTVKNYTGKILGYYYPDRNVTTDFTGKVLYRGDVSSALLIK